MPSGGGVNGFARATSAGTSTCRPTLELSVDGQDGRREPLDRPTHLGRARSAAAPGNDVEVVDAPGVRREADRCRQESLAAIEDYSTCDADTGPFAWSTSVDAVLDRARDAEAVRETSG